MCGRYSIVSNFEAVRRLFGTNPNVPNWWVPRSNVAPTEDAPAVRLRDGERELVQLRWGLVPYWSKDAKIAYSTINARSETAASAPAFREAFTRRRCLVVTDGFYEWKKPEKEPFAIAMADKSHMVMAGLWDEWTDKKTGERIKSCTIITCPANALVGALHDRMPVIVAEEDWAKWLGEEPATPEELKALLVPFKGDALTIWPVNRQKLGNVRNKDREVAEPEVLDALSGS